MAAKNDIARTNRSCGRVSILLVNYNGAPFLRDCLNSLRTVTYPDFEVVLVDNASTDGSVEIVREFPGVRLVRSERNLGFAGGNNLGLQYCTGRYVLLLNTDTRVTPGFLEPLCAYLDAHPEVGIVQAKMTMPRMGNTLDACGSFITPVGFLYHVGIRKPDSERYARDYPVFTGKGACLMFRRELIDAVGGFLFKEEFFCYYEETDFCIRAWLAGFETHFVHGAQIEHLQGATVERTHGQVFMLSSYLRNQTLSLLSNLQLRSLLWIMPGYAALFIAGLVLSGVLGKTDTFWAFARAAWGVLKNLGLVCRGRRIMRKIRRVNDRAIFAKTMKWPGWRYFYLTFKGRLDLYQDRF